MPPIPIPSPVRYITGLPEWNLLYTPVYSAVQFLISRETFQNSDFEYFGLLLKRLIFMLPPRPEIQRGRGQK